MPVALRPKGKARKIAYSILGVPANFAKRSNREKAIDKRLLFEETYRVR